METVVLKKRHHLKLKTKKIIGLIISFVIILFLFLYNFKITYKYYTIDEAGNVQYIGSSTDDRLIQKTESDYLRDFKLDGHLIADYGYRIWIECKPKIVLRKNVRHNENNIAQTIKNSIYIITYSYEFVIDEQTYIIPETEKKYIMSKIDTLTWNNFHAVYIDENKEISRDEIDKIIHNYLETHKPKEEVKTKKKK